jgi:predicted  nucleic acid-binding Zn-ribbon protein
MRNDAYYADMRDYRYQVLKKEYSSLRERHEREMDYLRGEIEARNDRIRSLKHEMCGIIDELNAAKKTITSITAERVRVTDPDYLEIT